MPYRSVVAVGYSINGDSVGLTVTAKSKWIEIPIQRGEGEYTCTTSVSKAGTKHSHKATMEVLTISAAVEHTYRELSRTRHLLALVLNSGETIIVGIYCPARLAIEPYTADKPEDSIGFSLKFTCESRIGYERFTGALEEAPVTPVVPVSGFGFLYNSYVLNITKSLVNEAEWRLPTINDANNLIAIAITSNKLAVGSDWTNSFNGPMNELNFCSIPSGQRFVLWDTSFFIHRGYAALYWLIDKNNALALDITPSNLTIENYSENYHPLPMWLKSGRALRLVKTYLGGEFEKQVTDADGNIYGVVLIGNLLWTTSDFRGTKYIDGTPIPLAQLASEWEIAGENYTAARCEHPGINEEPPM